MQHTNVSYLSVEDILHIRDRLAEQHNESYDILRFQQLLSAIAAPQQVIFGEEIFPTLCAKAGMLLTGIIRNHPFWDGNKRIALESTRLFLERNGYQLNMNAQQADSFMLKLAQAQADPEAASTWLKQHVEPLNP